MIINVIHKEHYAIPKALCPYLGRFLHGSAIPSKVANPFHQSHLSSTHSRNPKDIDKSQGLLPKLLQLFEALLF